MICCLFRRMTKSATPFACKTPSARIKALCAQRSSAACSARCAQTATKRAATAGSSKSAMFTYNPDLPEERKMLGIIAYGGAGNVRNAENFFTLKGIIEKLFEILGIENARFERGGGAYLHPGQKAVVSIDGEVIGEMGCTHPRVEKNFGLSCNAYLAEIDFNKLAAHTNNSRKYRPLPKFPIVPRDIAVVVDRNIEAQTVIDIINTAKTQVIVENAKVFDVYYPKEAGDKGIPEGKKSMAFSFELRSDERTLTDEDINRAVNTILKALKFRLDAVLRS